MGRFGARAQDAPAKSPREGSKHSSQPWHLPNLRKTARSPRAIVWNGFAATDGGQYSIRINDRYRICFRWVNGETVDVEIVDYH